MKSPAALLVSPHPVDGYPPVQHQARLLADAGYRVELLTTPLGWAAGVVGFTHPGVAVHVQANLAGPAASLRRTAGFISILAALRLRARSGAIEIAYEPTGMLYSDLAPLRPRARVAHFHECLQLLDKAWIERRVKRSIASYDFVVVPDAERARLLAEQLSLATLPTVVPNYPIADSSTYQPSTPRSADAPFTLIYCGSVGIQQKLDFIIGAIGKCPPHVRFAIVGNADTKVGEQLRGIAREVGVESRVAFEGWLAYDEVPARLARADLAIAMLDPSFEQWRTALGASNKRYEYMRSGLPQIGDMNPGVPELLEGQGVGLCLRNYDMDELAAIVTAYASDPERCHAEGARALALHRDKYNYERAFRPVLDWLQNEAGPRSAGQGPALARARLTDTA